MGDGIILQCLRSVTIRDRGEYHLESHAEQLQPVAWLLCEFLRYPESKIHGNVSCTCKVGPEPPAPICVLSECNWQRMSKISCRKQAFFRSRAP